MNTKQLIPFTLTAITCLGLSANQVQAATFNFSGFSISDGTNSYEAKGSFELADDFSGAFNINTPDISTTLNIALTTVSGTPANFIFDSSNINFAASTFTGTVTGPTATLETISLSSSSGFLGDNIGGQTYINFASGVFLNSTNGNVSGTPFNDATAEPIPEPISILGSFFALGFGVLFKKVKPGNKFQA